MVSCSAQCPVTVSSSLTSSSASPVSGTILSAGGSSLVSVAGTTTNHPLGVAAGLSNARMAVTSAVVRPPGSPTTSVSPSQGHPPPTTGGPAPTGRCCDTGRPIFTDPLTGQTVCSCQYELLGGYQRLGALPTAALSMYSAPYAAAAAAAASEGMAAYFPSLGAEQAPFYTPTVSCSFFYFIFSHFPPTCLLLCSSIDTLYTGETRFLWRVTFFLSFFFKRTE